MAQSPTIKWIRTGRLSIQNSLSLSCAHSSDGVVSVRLRAGEDENSVHPFVSEQLPTRRVQPAFGGAVQAAATTTFSIHFPKPNINVKACAWSPALSKVQVRQQIRAPGSCTKHAPAAVTCRYRRRIRYVRAISRGGFLAPTFDALRPSKCSCEMRPAPMKATRNMSPCWQILFPVRRARP